MEFRNVPAGLAATVYHLKNEVIGFDILIPYGIINHMKARKLFNRKILDDDGSITEMVIWKLPKKGVLTRSPENVPRPFN
jgi:hypothetical protein